MAFPTRSRGLRSITVNEVRFRWRLKAGVTDSALLVYSSNSGTPLRVTLREWRDHLIMYPFLMPNNPAVITSDFVRSAIEFGLQNSWAPDMRGKEFEVEWRREGFHLVPEAPSGQADDSRSTSLA